MDTPSPPGRRDNGLQSADWGALVDLDPRLSEALLSSLASADVPAFVEPAGGSNAWTRAAQLPDRPLHRLWVDPSKADTARSVVAAEVADLSALLAEHDPGATAHGFVQPVPRTAAARVLRPPALPDPPSRRGSPAPDDSPAEKPAGAPSAGSAPEGPDTGTAGQSAPAAADRSAADDDAVWQQIIADFGKDADGPVPPWPVVEDVEPRLGRLRPARPGKEADEPPRRRRTDPREPADALPGWVEPEAVEDEGHYVPPPPPPVPRIAPRKVGAALVVLAGLLLMFAPGLLLQPRTPGVGMLGVLLTVAGAAALVWLMRDAPPSDRGPDDGAVV